VQRMSLDDQVFFGICFGGMLWKRFSDCMPSKSYIKKPHSQKIQFFFFAKIQYGLYVLDRFDVLMLKMIFLK
jgi:hypothetical protein